MTPKKQYYENLAESLIEKFSQRQIEAYYAATKEEALDMACRYLSPESSVSWGGSMTLNEIGLVDAINESDCIIYDRASAKTPEEKEPSYDDRPVRLHDAGAPGGGEAEEKLFLCGHYLRHSQHLQVRGASGHPSDVGAHGDRHLEGHGQDRGRSAQSAEIPLQVRDQYYVRLQ